MFSARTVFRLFKCMGCQYAKNHGDTVYQIELCNALCNTLAYKIEMTCFTLYYTSQT